MNSFYLCAILAACFAVCYSRDISVNSSAELETAMKNVLPGDKVIVAPGKYQINSQTHSNWIINAAGTSEKPIVLTCAVEGLCLINDAITMGGCSYFTFAGFAISNPPYSTSPLTVQDCNHITLTSLDIDGGDDQTLWFLRTSFSTIQSCTFTGSKVAIWMGGAMDNTFTSCTIGNGPKDYGIYISNSTRNEFSKNHISCETISSGGSWILEYDSGGNMFSDNEFGFVYTRYQKSLNGYLARGNCVYGPTTLENNYMDLKSGVAFAGCKDYKNRVCDSNVVDGDATFTDGHIDHSC